MSTKTSISELSERADSSALPTGSVSSLREDDEISVLDLLIVLTERKRVIVAVVAVFVLTAVVISLLLPARYTAETTLLPPQQSSSMASILASQLGSLGGMAALAGGTMGLKNPNDMYVAMLKSRTVEDGMIKRFNLMAEYHSRYLSQARTNLEHHVNIDGSGKDGLIRISFDDKDPRRAAELANGYVDEFRGLSEHLAITEASQRRLFFQGQLEQAKDNLASAEEELKKTEQKTGLIQLDSQARALIESAASLRAQIAAKEVQIQAMQTYATGENSQMVQSEQELEGMRAQLAKLAGNADTSQGLLVPKGMVPQAGLEYIRKLRDVKYYETIFEILARQFEMAKLDEAKQGAIIQVVDAAVPPDRRSFPKRALIVLGALVAGLFVGVGYALTSAGINSLNAEPENHAKIAYLKQLLAWRSHSAS